MAEGNSNISAHRSSKIAGVGGAGVFATDGSTIEAKHIEVTETGDTSVIARNGSYINIRDGSIFNTPSRAISAELSSRVNFMRGSIDAEAFTSVICSVGSFVNLQGTSFSELRALQISTGSTIIASGVTNGRSNVPVNTPSERGIIYAEPDFPVAEA